MNRKQVRLLVALVVAIGFLALGGLDAIKSLRRRWSASLNPPTADQLAARPDPVVELRATLPPEAVRGRMWLSDPPRPATVAVVLSSILICTLGVMYFTGRPADR